jgi:HTH-type transcriptional regulator/antitoxin HipB
MRTMDEWDPTCEWTAEEVEHYLLGPFEGGIPGLVRRLRRTLDVSQRGLAALIKVSQSVVARWETGRTSPRASVLHQLLRLAGIAVRLDDVETGKPVEPMRDDGDRDRAGRRYPAHVDLTVAGWWRPRGLECTAEWLLWPRWSRTRKDPAVRFHTSGRHLHRSIDGTPVDHPSHVQHVAEAVHLDEVREQWLREIRARSPWLRPPPQGLTA